MKLNPLAVMTEQGDGTGLVFDPATNWAISLNPVGVHLWKQLKNGADESVLISFLLDRYENITKERAAADVQAFLSKLRSRSLLLDS